MCDSHVGVVKRLDLETISKEILELASGLDEDVRVDVSEIRKAQANLELLIKGCKE